MVAFFFLPFSGREKHRTEFIMFCSTGQLSPFICERPLFCFALLFLSISPPCLLPCLYHISPYFFCSAVFIFIHAAVSTSISLLLNDAEDFAYAPTEGCFDVLVTDTRLPQFLVLMDNFKHVLLWVSVGVCVQYTPGRGLAGHRAPEMGSLCRLPSLAVPVAGGFPTSFPALGVCHLPF